MMQFLAEMCISDIVDNILDDEDFIKAVQPPTT